MQIAPSRAQYRNQTTPATHEIHSLTDKERDEIDYEAKSIIRQTMDRIKHLEALENGTTSVSRLTIERRTRAEKTGLLGRFMTNPDAEALNALLSTHRGAITWYLSKKLTEASDVQRNQQEIRLMREVEKSKRYLEKGMYLT
jgi:syntaxin 18